MSSRRTISVVLPCCPSSKEHVRNLEIIADALQGAGVDELIVVVQVMARGDDEGARRLDVPGAEVVALDGLDLGIRAVVKELVKAAGGELDEGVEGRSEAFLHVRRELLIELHASLLVLEIFRMLEGQVEEDPLHGPEKPVGAGSETQLGDESCLRILGESVRGAAVDDPRQLVEKQNQRQPSARRLSYNQMSCMTR